METAVVIKAAVSAAPYSIDKAYDYLVPAPLVDSAQVGVRITVPFGKGNRESEAMILSREGSPKTQGLKAVLRVLDDAPVMDRDEIDLALWMRRRYFCTLYDAIRTILPAGVWYDLEEIWTLCADAETAKEAAKRIRGAQSAIDALSEAGGSAKLSLLRETLGEGAEKTLKSLAKKGLVSSTNSAKRRISDRNRRMAELCVSAEDALRATEQRITSAPMQHAVVEFLVQTGRTSVAEVQYYTGATMATLKALEKKGILAFSEEEELRLSLPLEAEQAREIVLNGEQQAAFQSILQRIESAEPSVTLLRGVTGSGKTEVYLRLVQETLRMGKRAIVLVPEIVLTPQMMRKFASRFGCKVAMLHSSLRLSERYDQWKRIRRGEVEVVLGTRSAVFAPLRDLGLIVMDEEQEGSYASENPPRYHAREIAKYLCAKSGAALVLGSATPSVESAWEAERGAYQKALLRRRYNEGDLPQVMIADLREELRNGNAGVISGALYEELKKNIAAGEQSILLLNRRGNSRMLLCPECGCVPECPRCTTALTYHSANERLMCHYCGHSEAAKTACPNCGGQMKRVGTGTQRAEEELSRLFPDARVLRMDSDTVTQGHEKVLREFEDERVPILLGTQMVAKGLDFENVTLVGVLCADLSLYADDYLAAERTFNLLTQVVGRAGRGAKRGRALIQTYTPENEVIRCAARQDYEAFYENEVRLRRLRRYPPFADFFTLTVSGSDEGRVLRAAAGIRDTLKTLCERAELAQSEPEVLGPASAAVVRVNNRYRYHCVLVGKNDRPTREALAWLLRAFASDHRNRGVHVSVTHNTMEV